MIENILIDLQDVQFNKACGGVVVQFELCKILCELGINAKIKSKKHIRNRISNNYYDNDFPIDDTTVVIYGETISGNPLNAKYVVRWILAEIGICSDKDIYKTWGENDLVYYFNAERKFDQHPEKLHSIYKLLSCIYIDPMIQQINFDERSEFCYTMRKSHMHKNGIKTLHPLNSFEVTRNHQQKHYVTIFNKYKYFVSYDPLTFLTIIAALCGCISIVHPLDGLSKEDWLHTTALKSYLISKNLDNMYGVAYGIDDIEYASNTIHLLHDQMKDFMLFCRNKTIKPFIKDIQDFQNMQNTVKNNYFM